MCVETCVKISEKSDEKWRSYSIRNLSSFVREVYIDRPGALRVRRAGDGGTGLNYWFFFYWKTLGVLFLPSMSCVTSRQTGKAEVSNTQDFMEEECRKIALSPASELALPNDYSKHDCAGGKFKLLPGYLTDRDVLWLISKRKIRAIP